MGIYLRQLKSAGLLEVLEVSFPLLLSTTRKKIMYKSSCEITFIYAFHPRYPVIHYTLYAAHGQ